MIVKALGQEPLLELLRALPGLKVNGGKLPVDRATGATGVPKLFAGGDCIRGGGEIVDAVQDGKIAAAGIHRMLTTEAAQMKSEGLEFSISPCPSVPLWLILLEFCRA